MRLQIASDNAQAPKKPSFIMFSFFDKITNACVTDLMVSGLTKPMQQKITYYAAVHSLCSLALSRSWYTQPSLCILRIYIIVVGFVVGNQKYFNEIKCMFIFAGNDSVTWMLWEVLIWYTSLWLCAAFESKTQTPCQIYHKLIPAVQEKLRVRSL